MTISGWVLFGIITAMVLGVTLACVADEVDNIQIFSKTKTDVWPYIRKIVLIVLVAAIIISAVGFGLHWYFTSTASGQRAVVDQRSNIRNGLRREITVYTADGKEMAHYEGRIDISAADGYVKFDLDGKRYIYYNCFVECIADINE